MKVHYINILLFALPLNILVYNQGNHKSPTPSHTAITRLLCECELYESANYDSDPQMKSVMDNFNKQTQQRFHEYDDRMKTNRKKCKDKCDKEIQKIILKDKLEKQMAQQLTTLETKITTEDIPTCVCEKSLADKMEKECLRCAQNLGGIVAPSSGILGEIAAFAVKAWKAEALEAAKAAALTEAKDLATQAGIDAVITKIEGSRIFYGKHEIDGFISIVTEKNFNSSSALRESVVNLFSETCKNDGGTKKLFCSVMVDYSEDKTFTHYVNPGIEAYNKTLPLERATLETAKVGAVEATYASYQTAIIASIVAIVVIVLIMVIIYLILRYRRKKKMKKKLQYIKLLEE
ncbi:rifin PIR protein, putative [Plasmodium reichenowi]|uniref:Rifin PIR protein, putative n=1 Tax=Plasmodium reichenowi TaxID=5854 RepID=A0A2P9DKR8_PLARE|nr:rifin PIR protein, putative [Plasmodium reichenowi]